MFVQFLVNGERKKQAEIPKRTVKPKTETGTKLLKERVPNEKSVVRVESKTAKAVESEWSAESLKNNE